MSDYIGTSPFAEQRFAETDYSQGQMFQHYQHRLTGREEAVYGMRCVGLIYPEIANLLKTTQAHVKQLERRAHNHIMFLYRKGT